MQISTVMPAQAGIHASAPWLEPHQDFQPDSSGSLSEAGRALRRHRPGARTDAACHLQGLPIYGPPNASGAPSRAALDECAAHATAGLRVLLFARSSAEIAEPAADVDPVLPHGLRPQAIITCGKGSARMPPRPLPISARRAWAC